MDDDVRAYRRFLPHFRADGAVYFVTWRLERDRPRLTALERDDVCSTLRFFDGVRYRLYAYVVMDDHVHVIVQPTHDIELQKLVHSWKSYSAVCLQRGARRGRVWQREYFDRIVRDEAELAARIDYVLGNAQARWPGVEGYPWMWCRRDLLER
jgi:putative transposase